MKYGKINNLNEVWNMVLKNYLNGIVMVITCGREKWGSLAHNGEISLMSHTKRIFLSTKDFALAEVWS